MFVVGNVISHITYRMRLGNTYIYSKRVGISIHKNFALLICKKTVVRLFLCKWTSIFLTVSLSALIKSKLHYLSYIYNFNVSYDFCFLVPHSEIISLIPLLPIQKIVYFPMEKELLTLLIHLQLSIGVNKRKTSQKRSQLFPKSRLTVSWESQCKVGINKRIRETGT